MADCIATTIDSNRTGLRIAEEECLGRLGPLVVWEPYEPNSYSDFGGEVVTTARNPLNPSRQRQKGVPTDLNASGAFNTDVGQDGLQNILQGFMFANIRHKGDTKWTKQRVASVTAAGVYAVSDVTLASAVIAAGGSGYAVDDVLTVSTGATTPATLRVSAVNAGAVTAVVITNPGSFGTAPANPLTTTGGTGTGCTLTGTFGSGASWKVGQLVLASGFTATQNNRMARVTAVSGTSVTLGAGSVVEAAPPDTARLQTVGAVVNAAVAVPAGDYPRLTVTGTDMTTLGIVPGEFVYVGGDALADRYANEANNGFKRVRAVTANSLVFDKSQETMVVEATKNVHLYLGNVLKNEADPALQVARSYQLERTLGSLDGLEPAQSEYLVGARCNEFNLNFQTAALLIADLSFIAMDHEPRTQAEGYKPGTRPQLSEGSAFNTSSNIAQIRLSQVEPGDANPTPLFAFVTEMSVSINNNISVNKALGKMGGIGTTAGTFAVSGTTTAYFSDIRAVQAVRRAADVSLHVALAARNAGVVMDMPLITLGNGRVTVEQDQAITLPLNLDAASGGSIHPTLNHTLLWVFFGYLPTSAEV